MNANDLWADLDLCYEGQWANGPCPLLTFRKVADAWELYLSPTVLAYHY